jgi:catechol 2,3-dioxygenase-like lactoylglutathione lyase family enzyme
VPTTSGFDHIATLTTDLDRFTRWYDDVFGD